MSDVFTFEFAVRYMEVDQQGVVFNGWYLTYFDEAMTAYLASSGLSYDDLKARGHDVMLVHSEIAWHDGLRWGDTASVAVSCSKIGRTSFTLDFQVRRSDEVVVDGRTVYVVVSTDGGGSQEVPQQLRAVLEPITPLR